MRELAMMPIRPRTCTIARLLILALFLTSLPIHRAGAALVSTEHALEAANADLARERISALLQRAEVRAELIGYGLDPDQAAARVARLSDEEIRAVAGRLDELPAGEGALGAVIGAALFVFVVLLVTDLLGLTDVFPFVRR